MIIAARFHARRECRLHAHRERRATEDRQRSSEREQLLERFEEVAAILQELDLAGAWDEATDGERRVLVEELVEQVTVFPDHLEVTIAAAPRLNVGLAEVGLGGSHSQIVGVGGPKSRICDW